MKKQPIGAKLHQTMDASVWAEDFMKIWGHRLNELDLDLLRGWFANSLMCGWDHAHRKLTPKIEKLTSLILLTDPAVSTESMNNVAAKQWKEWLRFEEGKNE